jgi:deoxyribose-phosphate aldolase
MSDVDALVDAITRRVAAQLNLSVSAGDDPNTPCDATDATCTGCGFCVTRKEGVVDTLVSIGGVRFGAAAGGVRPRDDLASMIDHTILKPDATREELKKVCEEARKWKFATVCVNASNIPLVAKLLDGSGVKPIAVVGFPLGAMTPTAKAFEAREAVRNGAREIDMVINIGALKSGDLRAVERDIEAVTVPCRDCGALSKVIIEAALLTDDEKVTASTLAKAAGADYVKTSTGFGPGGATAADVALMRRVVGAEMGVKAAGGVRDLESLKAMVAAGATRVGASAGVKILKEAERA